MAIDIIVYKGGEVSHYLPRKVWYALYKQELIKPPKNKGEPWHIPPEKFSDVDNLTVLEIEYEPSLKGAGSRPSTGNREHLIEAIKEGCRRAQEAGEAIFAKIRSGELSWFPCGGARISGIKRNTKFGKIFAELADTGKPTSSTRWPNAQFKAHGVTLYWGSSTWASVRAAINGPEAQAMVLDQAANKAFVEYVNEELGLSLYVATYID